MDSGPVNEPEENSGDDFVKDLLRKASDGAPAAESRLFELLYLDLRRLAAWNMGNQQPGQSLTPTGLVNETFVRLFGGRRPRLKDRQHFLALCCRVMRRVLVDRARYKMRSKRKTADTVSLSLIEIGDFQSPEAVLAIDQALTRLAVEYPRGANVVEMRFFGGLEDEEIAAVLNASIRTIQRDWKFSKAWLNRELTTGQ